MAKPKSRPESRAQLSLLLPIDSRRGSGQSLETSVRATTPPRVADNREVALRNLEKSGLRTARS